MGDAAPRNRKRMASISSHIPPRRKWLSPRPPRSPLPPAPAQWREGRIWAGSCLRSVSGSGGSRRHRSRRSATEGLLFGSEGNVKNFRGGLRKERHFRRAGTRGAGLGRGQRSRPGRRQRRLAADPAARSGSASGGCASVPGPAREPPGRPSPPCAPGGGGAPLPQRPWRGAAGRAMRPSSCRRPSAPCSSPAGRSSATRSASSVASAAWPRKPASARSGPPRYRPPRRLRPGGPRAVPAGLRAAGPSVAAGAELGRPFPRARSGFRVSLSIGRGVRARDAEEPVESLTSERGFVEAALSS